MSDTEFTDRERTIAINAYITGRTDALNEALNAGEFAYTNLIEEAEKADAEPLRHMILISAETLQEYAAALAQREEAFQKEFLASA